MKINEILNSEFQKRCFEEAEKIQKVKGKVIIEIANMDKDEFKKKVCFGTKRPFCSHYNRDYFEQEKSLSISPKKFSSEREYAGYIKITREYMETLRPQIGVEVEVDGEKILFAIPCPHYDKSWCAWRENYKDWKQELEEEDDGTF